MLKPYKFLLLTLICISSVCNINSGYCSSCGSDSESVEEEFFSNKPMHQHYFSKEQIKHVYAAENYTKISVGIDVSIMNYENSAKTGIVVVGLTSDNKIHILNNWSGNYSTSNSDFYNIDGKKYIIEDTSKYDTHYKFRLTQVDNYYNIIIPNEINLVTSIDEKNKESISTVEGKIKGIIKSWKPQNLVVRINGNSEYIQQLFDKLKEENNNITNMKSIESSTINTVLNNYYKHNIILHTYRLVGSELEKQMIGESNNEVDVNNMNALHIRIIL